MIKIYKFKFILKNEFNIIKLIVYSLNNINGHSNKKH